MAFLFALSCVSAFFGLLAAASTWQAVRKLRLEQRVPLWPWSSKRSLEIQLCERMYEMSGAPDDWAQGTDGHAQDKGEQGR